MQNGEKKPLVTEHTGFWQLFKRNWQPTIVYCGIFLGFGICVAFLGPTLLDLGCQVSEDMRKMSLVFFAQLLFVLIGSMFSGYLVNRIAADLMLFTATLLLPVCMAIIPFCKALWLLAVVLAVMGLNMGCIDCLANVQMIKTFGESVTPFLQAMHFFYGLGAFVSPMIAEPFLLNTDCSGMVHNLAALKAHNMTITLISQLPHQVLANETGVEEQLHEAQVETHIRYAFWIMACVMIPIPLLVGSLIITRRSFTQASHERLVETESNYSITDGKTNTNQTSEKHTSKAGLDENDGEKFVYIYEPREIAARSVWEKSTELLPSKERCCGSSTSQVVFLTLATAFMLFIYDGLQSAFGGYVYAYALKSIVGLKKTEGAYLNACFWGTFSIGRLLSVFVATKFSPAFMLMCNIGGSLFSMILMVSLRHDHVALYIGTCMFGIFLSSITPTALSLAEQYIDVTSSITAVIVTLAALGEMILPVVVGNLFVILGPVSFLVTGVIMTVLSIGVFMVIWCIGKNSPKQLAKTEMSMVWCHACCLKPKLDHDESQPHTVKYYSRMSESNSSIEMVDQKNEEKVMDS
ncbi:major facilitator superfamily domain-containing protein 4A-like isoform X2 [Lineus longissimus]|uniref:major facilitator superfamily domain-containing protein 4A-like isoform X2 n=1 Tax=Lineus longissimus TaxID=88925 RepID=UPI00315D7E16